jgi:hypothetical protein
VAAPGFQKRATLEKMVKKVTARQGTNPILGKLADPDSPKNPDQAAAGQEKPKQLRHITDPDPPEYPDLLRESPNPEILLTYPDPPKDPDLLREWCAPSSTKPSAQEVTNAVISMTCSRRKEP